MTTLLSPDRVRALLKTPGPTKVKVMPPPGKMERGISRGQLLTMKAYLESGHSEKGAATLAGIPTGSASYAGRKIREGLG